MIVFVFASRLKVKVKAKVKAVVLDTGGAPPLAREMCALTPRPTPPSHPAILPAKCALSRRDHTCPPRPSVREMCALTPFSCCLFVVCLLYASDQ